MRKSRVACWGLAITTACFAVRAHATAGMPVVDRPSLCGTWEGFDAAKGYLVLLRVEKKGPATLVLVHAAMPKQPSYRFEIADPKVSGNGIVDLVGSDQESGLRISAKGKGRAGGSIGLITLAFEWLPGRMIMVGSDPGEIALKKVAPDSCPKHGGGRTDCDHSNQVANGALFAAARSVTTLSMRRPTQ